MRKQLVTSISLAIFLGLIAQTQTVIAAGNTIDDRTKDSVLKKSDECKKAASHLYDVKKYLSKHGEIIQNNLDKTNAEDMSTTWRSLKDKVKEGYADAEKKCKVFLDALKEAEKIPNQGKN